MHLPIIPNIFRLFSPSGLHWNIKQKAHSAPGITHPKKSIYITFDDGPVPQVTPRVLEILKQYNAKATFFCVGDNVRKYPEVYQSVLADGHATGNHTFCHINGYTTDNSIYFDDTERCSEYVKSSLFRPPYGRIKYSQIKELRKKYTIIMWSVLTGDYNHSLTKEEVLSITLKHTKNGSIIVFHDSMKASERMFYALPKVLEHFTNLGYSFDKIPSGAKHIPV